MTIANMAIEAGAKTGFVDMHGLQLDYDFNPVGADSDAEYETVLKFPAADVDIIMNADFSRGWTTSPPATRRQTSSTAVLSRPRTAAINAWPASCRHRARQAAG